MECFCSLWKCKSHLREIIFYFPCNSIKQLCVWMRLWKLATAYNQRQMAILNNGMLLTKWLKTMFSIWLTVYQSVNGIYGRCGNSFCGESHRKCKSHVYMFRSNFAFDSCNEELSLQMFMKRENHGFREYVEIKNHFLFIKCEFSLGSEIWDEQRANQEQLLSSLRHIISFIWE